MRRSLIAAGLLLCVITLALAQTADPLAQSDSNATGLAGSNSSAKSDPSSKPASKTPVNRAAASDSLSSSEATHGTSNPTGRAAVNPSTTGGKATGSVLAGGESSTAHPAELQHYPNGFTCPSATTVQTSNGLTINFQGADPSDPEVCVWDYARREAKGRAFYLYQTHNTGDDTILLDQIREAYRELFPLSVGKTITKLVSGLKFKSEMRLVLTVEGISDVNIESGTRHAWVIHQEGFGTFDSDNDMDNRYWLEVGTFVLLKVSEDVNGSKSSFDVLSVQKGKPVKG